MGKGFAPYYATGGAAGLDIVAAEDLTLEPGQRHGVATGFAIAIPDGYQVQVGRARARAQARHYLPEHAGHDRQIIAAK